MRQTINKLPYLEKRPHQPWLVYALPLSWSNWNLECWFLWKEENWRTRSKTLGERRKPSTNSTHILHQARIEPGLHWWEASILATAPFLLPYRVNRIHPERISFSVRAKRWKQFKIWPERSEIMAEWPRTCKDEGINQFAVFFTNPFAIFFLNLLCGSMFLSNTGLICIQLGSSHLRSTAFPESSSIIGQRRTGRNWTKHAANISAVESSSFAECLAGDNIMVLLIIVRAVFNWVS